MNDRSNQVVPHDKAKRVLIFTLSGYYSYGTRLQNYAVCEVIGGLGYASSTARQIDSAGQSAITRVFEEVKKEGILKATISIGAFFLKNFPAVRRKKPTAARSARIRAFSNKYTNEACYRKEDLTNSSEFLSKYDFFITGSDQVWNPYLGSRELDSVFFLPFAENHQRIALSASFGISPEEFFRLPREHMDAYRKYLLEMGHLSVRENEGCQIVEKLTGRKAEVLIDPTMLLPKEKWYAIAQKPAAYEKWISDGDEYVLFYFLGKGIRGLFKRVKKLPGMGHVKLIALNDYRYKEMYLSDPSEFIWLVDHAKLVCTDSFHGSVFSILMETPFLVFDRIGVRRNMNSRLDTLLKRFDLENRRVTGNTLPGTHAIDWASVKSILEIERKKALAFLERVLVK